MMRSTQRLPYRGWTGRHCHMRWLGGELVDARHQARRPLLGSYVDSNWVIALFACGWVVRRRSGVDPISSRWARCLRLLDQ